MKLSQEEQDQIRQWFLENVTDSEKRNKVLTVAFAYAEDAEEESDIFEKVVWYMSQPENAGKLDEQFIAVAGTTASFVAEGKQKK